VFHPPPNLELSNDVIMPVPNYHVPTSHIFGMKLPTHRPYYIVLALLLALFGYLAMGIVGCVLAFWTLLLWFSVWQRPYRFEMFLIASLGLIGAVAILPEKQWTESNVYFFVAFIVVAGSPIIDLLVLMFRPSRS
jgi:hypothetical protein